MIAAPACRKNHAFVKRFVNVVGIAGYRSVDDSRPHVVARRRDGRPDLHIYSGYTDGFLSEEEVVGAAGQGVTRTPSARKGWLVARTP